MTTEDIQAALDNLQDAMSEKGIIMPDPRLTMRGFGTRPYITLMCAGSQRAFDGETIKIIMGDTVADAVDAACAYIAALPSPETAAMHQYMRKLGEAVDFGVANGIAAEYVDPVRITQKAMTDNLLAAPDMVASHA